MIKILTGMIAAVAIFYLFRILASRRNKPEEPVTYVCDECGENDCVCHREDQIPK